MKDECLKRNIWPAIVLTACLLRLSCLNTLYELLFVGTNMLGPPLFLCSYDFPIGSWLA